MKKDFLQDRINEININMKIINKINRNKILLQSKYRIVR